MLTLVNVAKHFTTDVEGLGLLVRDNTFGSREDGDAEAVEHAGHVLDVGVGTQTRGADADELLDSRFLGLRMSFLTAAFLVSG